jgi:hypothetical protein
MSKEFFFFLSLTSFYLLIAAVEDYFFTMKHTQTTFGRTPLEERSASRRDLTANKSLKIHTSSLSVLENIKITLKKYYFAFLKCNFKIL